MSQNILLVGSNRGIGLALVHEILDKLNPKRLFATYRTEEQSKELLELASKNSKIRLIQLDASEDSKFPAVAQQIESETKEEGLNLLIFNSAIFDEPPQLMAKMTKEILLRHFDVNAVAPFLLAKACLPLLEKASAANPSAPLGIGRAAIVNVSTIMSSNTLYEVTALAGPSYAYRSSKAALNTLTKTMSYELKDKNILAIAIHPGWVQTVLGGPGAPMTTVESASGIVAVLSNLNESQNGLLLQHDGATLPW